MGQKILILLALSLMVASSSWAVTSEKLAREQEQLYNRLEKNDALRPSLALRLADLLFDASTEVNKTDFSAAQAKRMEGYRLKAINLYESVLGGFSGQFPKPSRQSELRIQFQLARLDMDQGLINKAEDLWTKLAAQSEELKIQRESALRRAEKLELSTSNSEVMAAKKYYDIALPNCGGRDLCSYVYYRRGWARYRLGDSDAGLADLQKALELSDKASVAEILKDLTLFLSHATMPADKAVAYIDKLSAQFNRPDLLERLTDAYFTADHRSDYNYAVEILNKRFPRIDRMVTSLEFQYSERNSSKMQEMLNQLAQASPTAYSAPEKKAEVNKQLYRLIVQWDGEREKHPEYKAFLGQGVLLYTRLFPSTPEYDKVISGWLAAENDADKKINQLQLWATQQTQLKNKAESLKLHQTRMAIAVKANKTATIIEESGGLIAAVSDTKEKRELTYQKAHAYYEQKQYDQALPIFVSLAKTNSTPDQTSIYSQNLALDILAQSKRYDEIMAQAHSWTKNPAIQAAGDRDPALAKELADMNAIAEKALFEKSSTVANAESLKNFTTFCMADKFLPKSCENAKTLAVQLKDQDTLIAILKKLDRKPELTSELEFGGHFAQAAQMLEPGLNDSKVTFEDHLRIAMLYELAGDYKNRDRILRGAMTFVMKSKKPLSAPEEDLLYLTLKDAGLLNSWAINLPWSENRKLKLASELEAAGTGSTQTRALIAASCVDTGERWEQIRLTELNHLYSKERAIKFVGRASQKHFNERIKALKNLADGITCYLKGSDSEHRYATISTISRAYKEMADEIRTSPIPDGLDEETLTQVKAQINEAAKPFDSQSADWAKQATTQLDKVAASDRAGVQQKYANWSFEVPEVQVTKLTQPQFDWGSLLERLKKNPFDNQNLVNLKQHFDSNGEKRLSAYFEGRLSSGKKE